MLTLLVALSVDREPTPAERTAIFTAAGFHQRGDTWHSDCENPDSELMWRARSKAFRTSMAMAGPKPSSRKAAPLLWRRGLASRCDQSAKRQMDRLYASRARQRNCDQRKRWPDIEMGTRLLLPILRWTERVCRPSPRVRREKAASLGRSPGS